MSKIKYSVYLTPTQFAMFPFHDVSDFISCVLYDAKTGGLDPYVIPTLNTDAEFVHLNSDWVKAFQDNILERFEIPSTDIISPNGDNQNKWFDRFRQWHRTVAFNPPHSMLTGGSLFNYYFNCYSMFKFCGMKVKFTPANRKGAVTTFPTVTKNTAYPTAIVTEEGTTYNVPIAGLPQPGEQPGLLQYTLDPTIPSVGASTYDEGFDPFLPGGGLVLTPMNNEDDKILMAPPQFRIWIDFKKDEFVCNPLPPIALNVTVQKLLNGLPNLVPNTWQNGLIQSRFLSRRTYYNQNLYSNALKSYSLTKPFKFYVKPYSYDISSEHPGQTTKNIFANVEYKQLEEVFSVKEGDVYFKKPKRQGYLMNPNIYPVDTWMALSKVMNDQIENTNQYTYGMQNNSKILNNFSEKSFYNPPLFGFFFTRDDLDKRLKQQVIRINKYVGGGYQGYGNQQQYGNYSMVGCPAFENCGKFKLTFYYRFKGKRKHIPNINLSVENYMLTGENWINGNASNGTVTTN